MFLEQCSVSVLASGSSGSCRLLGEGRKAICLRCCQARSRRAPPGTPARANRADSRALSGGPPSLTSQNEPSPSRRNFLLRSSRKANFFLHGSVAGKSVLAPREGRQKEESRPDRAVSRDRALHGGHLGGAGRTLEDDTAFSAPRLASPRVRECSAGVTSPLCRLLCHTPHRSFC